MDVIVVIVSMMGKVIGVLMGGLITNSQLQSFILLLWLNRYCYAVFHHEDVDALLLSSVNVFLQGSDCKALLLAYMENIILALYVAAVWISGLKPLTAVLFFEFGDKAVNTAYNLI